MNSPTRILSYSDHLIGRDAEIERLRTQSRRESGGLTLLATPLAGTSALLRQTYDSLFAEQEEIIPFYFEIKPTDGTARTTALRFLREFLLQTVAFRRRDPGIIASTPEICEIAELAIPEDGHWIDRLVNACESKGRLIDDHSLLGHAIAAPQRAAAGGARSFVMIDNCSTAMELVDGDAFVEILKKSLSLSRVPFVVAGRRREMYTLMAFEPMNLDNLSFHDSCRLIESIAAQHGISINDETRDLMAIQLGGSPTHINTLLAWGKDLDSFQRVERAYVDQIFSGPIARTFDAMFDAVIPGRQAQMPIIKLLLACLKAKGGAIPEAYFRRHASGDRVLDRLNGCEILGVADGSITVERENIALCDYIHTRGLLEIEGVKRALAVGTSLSKFIKRAPAVMARHYRRSHSLGLGDVMLAFDGQTISPATIDYERFQNEFKGVENETVLKLVGEDKEEMVLPRIAFTAHSAAFYPPLDALTDRERSAVAMGSTTSNEEVVWIAAEIDSKLEADATIAEFWCDRLEMVALNCNFRNVTIWLVAPEGFSKEALETLKKRNAFGSGRKQVQLLAQILGVGKPESTTDNYAITVPMGEATELIAAHTAEEIAGRHGFSQKAINQIKTALVEACINAAEHSLSPDERVHVQFQATDEQLAITVTNRGLRLADKPKRREQGDDERRGWGLKLIRGLMDEVTIGEKDDGTQITMSKYKV